MKEFIKYIMFVVMLFCITSQAAVVTGVYNGAPTTNAIVRSGGALVSTVTLSTSNALGTMVHIFDSSLVVPTNLLAAYTNRVVYTTNLVNNYVTTTGVTNFHTNLVQISRNEAKAAATIYLPAVATYFIPGVNTPQTFTLDAVFAKGIVVSNSTPGATVIVNYRAP